MSARSPGGPGTGAPAIVVTQSEGASGSLAEALSSRGVHVLALPTIRIEPPEDWGPLDCALEAIDSFDWIVFTSVHAVDSVAGRPAWTAARGKRLPGLRVAAVGRTTARRLTEIGVSADLVPDAAGAEGLADALGAGLGLAAAVTGISDSHGADAAPGARGEGRSAGVRPGAGRSLRVLWPRSDIARRDLPRALARLGAEVVETIAYRTIRPSETAPDEVARRIEAGEVAAVTFMSPSSAHNLATLLGWSDLRPLARLAVVASIGPTTSAALRELGAAPEVESAARTAPDLAATLLAYLDRREPPR